ncbi:DUF5671 domain-containing protein [Pseudonocardia abyssalis]|uniref:DUF5671 domain-containing protein n=1 Tax=Pseudonocardia abyssalis TaxID=2792008 RepID=A0ABS6UNL3_9PSEU|nr:DUF5671 domain-containing protein [Pseudonocardia abyssalis]MBW0118248.1 hypothetical protein [Pseudonocardia abyssalis]MBW0133824.1 hypothetical protein [Pseudonocardia abyssalis]
MAGALLVPVVLLVLVALAAHGTATGRDTPSDGHAVRRAFQYLLLYGLAVVIAVGLAGLLGRVLEGATLARSDGTELARDLAFTAIGVPLFAGMALWSRRTLAADPAEARSTGWAVYVTAAALTALAMAMTGAESALRWAVGLQAHGGPAVAQVIVWGGMWAAHRWIDRRLAPARTARVHHLAGSLLGLATAATGLGGVLAGALRVLWGLDTGTLLAGAGSPILQGLATAVPGAVVWWVYWVRTAARDERGPLWLGYVLLAGVAGGLVGAIVAASALAWSGLVWLVGEPSARTAAEHFSAAPTETAAAAVGVLVWWYHQAVLRRSGAGTRTEVTRVHEYLMAGIALLAAAGGLTTLVAVLVDTLAGSAFVGGSTVNTLLAAVTLLAVGGPVWGLYWRRIQAAARSDPAGEIGSPTRRVYLSVLFGVGAVATVGALVVAAYLLFSDLVPGTVGPETARRMRFAIGVLLSAPAIAGYHWTVRRDGHRRLPAPAAATGPAFVLLVGPADRATVREVAHRTRGRVEAWARIDDDGPVWTAEDVMAALADTPADEVVVLSDAGRLHAVPVRRRPAAPDPVPRRASVPGSGGPA